MNIHFAFNSTEETKYHKIITRQDGRCASERGHEGIFCVQAWECFAVSDITDDASNLYFLEEKSDAEKFSP